MSRDRLVACVAVLALVAAACTSSDAPKAEKPATTTAPADRAAEQRAASLVEQMTPAERIDLVAAGTGVPRLGIPSLENRDGPNGIGHGEQGVTAFPNAVNIGAAWDPGLAKRFGVALGEELRDKGFDVLFGPTIETLRTPLWGRAAETYGEDPYLASSLVVPEVQGIQSRKVLAQLKHYVGNTQEIGRLGIPLAAPGVNDEIGVRTLHEMYLPAFEAGIRDGGASSVMCSYNRINGTQSCQDPGTLGIVHGWSRGAFVGPDSLLAVRDTPAAANAGVDNFQLASPDGLKKAVAAGQVPQPRIDDAARRIVTAMVRVGMVGAPAPTAQPVASTPEHLDLATEISTDGTVLLRNQAVAAPGGGKAQPVLPLTGEDTKIAVIGHDAGEGTQSQEGGSAAVIPNGPVITPLAGIQARAPKGTTVTYAEGTRGVVPLTPVPATALIPEGGAGQGLTGTFFADRTPKLAGPPLSSRVDPTLDARTVLPGGAGSARWTGTITAPTTGDYVFSLTVSGYAKLTVGGADIATGDTEWINLSPATPDLTFQGTAHLTAGVPVPIAVEYAVDASSNGSELHLGWQPPEPELRAEAVEAAKRSDVAVVFVNDVTSEGMDRPTLALPGDQDQLVEAVAAANPRTVVVLHTASAVLMPWRDQVAAIVEAWYPGQQSGTAIARTLFGDTDPGGRLPVTFAVSDAQVPPSPDSPGTGEQNAVAFDEGLDVGYRWFDSNHDAPLYPFGFGLSYTTWKLDDLRVEDRGNGRHAATVKVTNTGDRAGSQVVQLYLGSPKAAHEPPLRLRAFQKVTLAPGRSRQVTLDLDPRSFQVYDEATHRWKTVPGTYQVRVGTSSRDLPLHATVAVS